MDASSPLLLKPRFSKKLAIVLVVLHGSTGILLWTLTLPTILKLLILMFIIISLWQNVRYHLLFKHHPLKVCTLFYDEIRLQEWQRDEVISQMVRSLYFYAVIRCFLGKKELMSELKYPLLKIVLSPDSYFSNQLIILRVSVQLTGYLERHLCLFSGRKPSLELKKRKIYSLVLFSDALEPTLFRVLRIRLQHVYQNPQRGV
jgi:hypothetical protein